MRSTLRALYDGSADFDFPRLWKVGYAVTAVIIAVSVGALAVRGLNLGIDFEGGGVWEVPANGRSVEDTRDALRPLGQADAKIQTVTSEGAGGDGTVLRVQIGVEAIDESGEITDALAELTGVTPSDVSVNTVGPSWGDEITSKAQRALVVFFVLIALYITIRLEWRMAVGALVAVVHDIVVSVGIYALFQFEVTPATVIAFLTILGYSLYDTIVVYDKVYENTARLASTKATYTEIMNRSMNQVLMRSINTTITTVVPVLAMLIIGSLVLGATTLQFFAVALLIGLLSGAYSSIFVAAPVVTFLKERDPSARTRVVDRGDRHQPGDLVATGAERGRNRWRRHRRPAPQGQAEDPTVTVTGAHRE